MPKLTPEELVGGAARRIAESLFAATVGNSTTYLDLDRMALALLPAVKEEILSAIAEQAKEHARELAQARAEEAEMAWGYLGSSLDMELEVGGYPAITPEWVADRVDALRARAAELRGKP